MFKFAAVCIFSLTSSVALAHTDEYLDTQKGANNGQLRMAGAYHFELVVVRDGKEAKDKAVFVHVTDHAGTKVSTVGAGGTATILAGKQKATVKLAPDGDNRMKGIGQYLSTPDMKVVVSITLPGKAAEQARFTPLTAAKDEHAGKAH
ncbi:MAG: hypothetical protein K9J80_01120 [Sulfuritalea sp.]|nr:hypothetical protein [Sulfuritalea sp.]